jgi:selenocysteine lyase/cysteine desulfurase
MHSFNRRSFLQKAGAISATGFLAASSNTVWGRNLEKALLQVKDYSPAELAKEEDFWLSVQKSFNLPQNLINLNNGGVSPAPRTVQEAVKRHYDFCNQAPSYYMWRELDKGREPLRKKLAALAGCDAEEIAMNRNTSEGLETVIFGLQLKPGDEVVVCIFDYPNMMNAWKQREQREKIKLVWVKPELPSENEEYLVKKYVDAFTPATKVVHITQVINWNGQIMPVRKIADEAHKRGIEVVVDGAHSFAHLQFTIPSSGADYFATSLHKWLYAPVGTGMLYVKKEKIANLYPLFATSDNPLKDDIRKFEHLGTRPFFIEQAIGQAITFHDMIGSDRKEKRLHYLKNYWMEKVRNEPRIKLQTSTDPQWSCAIGNVAVEGRKPGELENFLLDKYKIHTVNIDWENIRSIRVTPNVYTSTKNLDTLVEGILKFARS